MIKNVSLLLLLFTSVLAADDSSKILLDFGDSKTARSWRAVNDGVMGGRSGSSWQNSGSMAGRLARPEGELAIRGKDSRIFTLLSHLAKGQSH